MYLLLNIFPRNGKGADSHQLNRLLYISKGILSVPDATPGSCVLKQKGNSGHPQLDGHLLDCVERLHPLA